MIVLVFLVFLILGVYASGVWVPANTSNALKHGNSKKLKLFPISIPILDGLYLMYILRRRGMDLLSDFAKQFLPGKLYEIPLPFRPFKFLLSNDMAFTQKVLSSSDPGHLNRPLKVFKIFYLDVLSEGLLGAPYEKWTRQRKVLARCFTTQRLQSFMETISRRNKELAANIQSTLKIRLGEKAYVHQLFELIDLSNLKIALEFIIGSDAELIDSQDAVQFSKDLLEFKSIYVYRILHPECYIPFVWWVHPKRREAKILEDRMRAYVKKIIKHYETRMGHFEESKQCLVQVMMAHGATPEEIYVEVGTFILTGHDTTTTAIPLLLHHLACHPEYQDRCRDEIDNLWDTYTSSLGNPKDQNINMEGVSKLKYLEMFVSESLRIAPIFPLTARELNAPLKINEECTLKKGQILGVSPWVIHHNPKYYPQPEVFNPDRFLPEEVAKRENGTFLPFTAGYRNCIGRRLALLELKAFAAIVLRNFDLMTDDGLHDVKLCYEMVLKPERPHRTILRMRKEVQDLTIVDEKLLSP